MSEADRIALVALDVVIAAVSIASLWIMLMGVRALRGKHSWLDRFLLGEHKRHS